MASWGSPRGRQYRDTSPTSPLTPLSPICLALGWMVTSTLGPDVDVADAQFGDYDTSSAGVLSDPSGFGTHSQKESRPGIIGSGDEDDTNDGEDHRHGTLKEPSISGALAELHHAVSDKFQSWNPYFAKSAHRRPGGSVNKTASTEDTTNGTAILLAGETVKDGVSEEERLGARTRIGKCTILFSGNSFWERCIRTHEQHDKVHGYRLHVLRQQLMDDVWSKPAYILGLLLREMAKPESERLDWLFWADADTVILNPNIPIETFLPPPGDFDDIYLMYSNDWNGLNNGVFPIRVNQWAVHLFSAIVSYRHFKPEDPLVFRDQSAMNSLMQEPEFAKHIVQAPQRWFNAYQGEHNETLQPFQIRRGDLLVHFAGVPAREERMGYWLDRAEQHLDDWEVPVKSTSYPQEARDFWNEQRELRKNKQVKADETRDQVSKFLTKIDQRLNDYGDRVDEEQKGKIVAARKALQDTFDQEQTRYDVEKLELAMEILSAASVSLDAAVTDANKLLLQSAHEAIFAGEKDLLEGGFSQGSSSPEMEQVSTAVKNLKTLVMAPEEFWNRHDLTSATNVVTEARAKLQEQLAVAAATLEQAEPHALQEIEGAVQLEAEGGTTEEYSTSLEGAEPSAVANVEETKYGLAAPAEGESGEVDEVETAKYGLVVPPEEESNPVVEVKAVTEVVIEKPTVAVHGVTVTQPGPIHWVTAIVTHAPASNNDSTPQRREERVRE
ncbi:hypothetical protein LTR37_020868 [Vermiconidia calcicola]|uniref:Uncharacterized protein n=1 Tax=Vermiconidia calcicola TaxID=1690605 RepID=A0ACC3MBU9_9PEZI|nr:hypothetical protein LTR37_020868 [Vermiconidia calcicola]